MVTAVDEIGARLLFGASFVAGTFVASTALAQSPPAQPPTSAPASTIPDGAAKSEPSSDDPDAQGKFTAGAQARFPSGPNAEGTFGSFNWIAVDGKGRYNPTSFLSTYLSVPLAVKKPDLPAPLPSPSLFGGFTGRAELGFGKTLGIGATLGFLREGAFLLSEKDYPYFHDDLKFGSALGPYVRFDMFGLLFTVVPQYVWQSGTGSAAQVPITAMLKLGSLLELSADAGVFTGPKFKLGAADGGRIYAGASLTLKLGPILLHVGSGVASLLTDPNGVYPSIKESIYYDVNLRYAN